LSRDQVEPKTIQKSDDARGEEEETSEVGEASGGEDVAALVVYSVPLGIRVVKVVIGFCVI
jgi:hypothetical protein